MGLISPLNKKIIPYKDPFMALYMDLRCLVIIMDMGMLLVKLVTSVRIVILQWVNKITAKGIFLFNANGVANRSLIKGSRLLYAINAVYLCVMTVVRINLNFYQKLILTNCRNNLKFSVGNANKWFLKFTAAAIGVVINVRDLQNKK